jgi:hypothetical protein
MWYPISQVINLYLTKLSDVASIYPCIAPIINLDLSCAYLTSLIFLSDKIHIIWFYRGLLLGWKSNSIKFASSRPKVSPDVRDSLIWSTVALLSSADMYHDSLNVPVSCLRLKLYRKNVCCAVYVSNFHISVRILYSCSAAHLLTFYSKLVRTYTTQCSCAVPLCNMPSKIRG